MTPLSPPAVEVRAAGNSPSGASYTPNPRVPPHAVAGGSYSPATPLAVEPNGSGEGFSFTIPGKPFAKQRPRFARGGRTYTPKETVSFERVVGQTAIAAGAVPIEGPVFLSIVATFEIPRSWSKARRAEALGQPHTQRPDVDNLQKAILDGLNRIAFADDGQVYRITSEKRWGETPSTVVEVVPC